VSYSRDLGINRAILAATDMIWTGDRFNSNDYITGKYRNVNFTYADVTIEESDSDSSGYYTTFKGQWMIFDFPKKFIHRIEIVQNDFYGGYKIARPKPNGRVFEEYTVESPTFQKKFRLLSDDSLDAFYVLDPDLIHRIELLSDNCEGSLLLCFVDNKLHVGLHNKKDSFEPPSPLKKINVQKENEKIINEFQNITNFVDYLKLGKNIFTNN
jgi:hypothetical protein